MCAATRSRCLCCKCRMQRGMGRQGHPGAAPVKGAAAQHPGLDRGLARGGAVVKTGPVPPALHKKQAPPPFGAARPVSLTRFSGKATSGTDSLLAPERDDAACSRRLLMRKRTEADPSIDRRSRVAIVAGLCLAAGSLALLVCLGTAVAAAGSSGKGDVASEASDAMNRAIAEARGMTGGHHGKSREGADIQRL